MSEKENEEIEARQKRLEKSYQHETKRVFLSKKVEEYRLGKEREKQRIKTDKGAVSIIAKN